MFLRVVLSLVVGMVLPSLTLAAEESRDGPATQQQQREATPKCIQVFPEIPKEAIRKDINGTVKAKITILQGAITEIEIVSGPEVFYEAVISAIKQYRCTSVDKPVTMPQEFRFRVSEPSTSGKPPEPRKPPVPVYQPLPGQG